MNFLVQSIGNIAGLCVGTAAVALGDPTGSKEAAIGAAGLIGFVLGQNAKFGPECARVRGRIQQEVMADYGHLLAGSDGDADAQIELEAADTALSHHLGACIIDRARLVQAALTPGGFPDQAVPLVMAELTRKCPDLFTANSLAHRFASDVVRAGLRAVVENAEYYRQLEPHLMLAMAQSIGGIDKKLDAVATTVGSLDTKIDAVLQAMQRQAGHRLDDAAIADLRALLAGILGQGISDEQIPAALIEARKSLDKFRAELEHLRGLANAVPEIEPHLSAARAALDSRGQIDLAAAQAEIRAAREQYATAIAARRDAEAMNLARLFEAEADLALARSDFLGAAELLAQAANGLPTGEAALQAELLLRQGAALFTHGELFPGLESLKTAIAAFEATAALYRQSGDLTNLALVQNNLGAALTLLGERLGGDEGRQYLEQAVQACKNALTVYSPVAMPTDWAMTQNNLGIALVRQGERLGDGEGWQYLHQAVQAYTNALTVYSQATTPTDWARTQNNLGNALQSLGERLGGDKGREYLDQAVQAYREALTIRSRDAMPTDWAMTQNNLGVALGSLGQRLGGDKGKGYLEQAVQTFRDARAVLSQTAMPTDWAMTQNNLGNALQSLGERLGSSEGRQYLEQAVQAYGEALTVRSQTVMPVDWAMTQNNLGNTLLSLGRYLGGDEGRQCLHQAVQAFRNALTVVSQAAMSADWAGTQNNLGNALGSLGRYLGGDEGRQYLHQAVLAYREALTVRSQTAMPADWAGTQNNLGNALGSLGERLGGEEGRQYLHQAVQAFKAALTVFTETAMPYYWDETQKNLARAKALLAQMREGEEYSINPMQSRLRSTAILGTPLRAYLPMSAASFHMLPVLHASALSYFPVGLRPGQDRRVKPGDDER